MAWGVMAVVAPVSSGPDALSFTCSARTGWLLLSAQDYGITACTAATLSLSLSLLAPYPPPPPPPPSPPRPSPPLPLQPRACSCSSSPLERFLPCGHRQAEEVDLFAARTALSSPPTASSPPPAAPCDALPAFLLCPASAPQRALRNETTPPRPRLYLRLRELLRPLANAAVSIPTPA